MVKTTAELACGGGSCYASTTLTAGVGSTCTRRETLWKILTMVLSITPLAVVRQWNKGPSLRPSSRSRLRGGGVDAGQPNSRSHDSSSRLGKR